MRVWFPSGTSLTPFAWHISKNSDVQILLWFNLQRRMNLTSESVRSRRRRETRRRRAWEQAQRKQPGTHRPDCTCANCTSEVMGPPCWSCGATRRPLPPRLLPRGPGPRPVIIGRNGYPVPHPGVHPPRPRPRNRERERRRGSRNEVVVLEEPVLEERMSQEDLRTWSLAYSLSIDVYVCAERYLMQDFKQCIAAFIINR